MSESRKSHVDELALEMQKKGEVGQLSLFAFQITVAESTYSESGSRESGIKIRVFDDRKLENFPVEKKIQSVFNQRICSIFILFIRRPL